jgi:hypothetical protein
MALPTNLTTNEVKGSAGTEVEFNHLSAEGRKRIFALVSEVPSQQHRITVQHQEIGAGAKLRRRSNIRVDKVSISAVDSVTPVTSTASIVLDSPVGALLTNAEAKAVLAELGSLVYTLTGTATFLYDGTGNGAAALLDGSI